MKFRRQPSHAAAQKANGAMNVFGKRKKQSAAGCDFYCAGEQNDAGRLAFYAEMRYNITQITGGILCWIQQ